MKKTNILKIAFTLVLAMMILGASAQTHLGTPIPGAAADHVSGATDATTYLTEGTTIPLFALPDPYFHPDWDLATADWTLTDGYTWNWDDPATTLTFSQDLAQDNYVEVSAALGDAGAYPITVSEVGAAGCAGATTTITITVVTQPSFAINTGDATYADCEAGGALPAAGDLETTIAGGWENYRLAWNLTIATLDDASAVEFWYTDEAGAGQSPVGTPVYGAEYTQANGSFDAQAASAAYDIVTVPSFDVINNGVRDAVTVYTYTLVSVNDRASRFGDFINLNGSNADASLFTDYAATAAGDVVTVTVYPAPITGPIYHIIDTWSN